MNYRKTIFLYCTFLLMAFLLSSCNNTNAPKDSTSGVNLFIYNAFNDVYLWSDELPSLNPKKESDPFQFFDKCLYKDDRWSLLTDNIAGLSDSFAGESASFGYSLAFYRAYKEEVLAVVEYVYAGSPAEVAGLKRGDVIGYVNGEILTVSNYTDLIYSSSITAGLVRMETANNIFDYFPLDDKEFKLQAVKEYMNPVLRNDIIESNGHKIGYLCYTGYLQRSHGDIKQAIYNFKAAGVTDMVLDLRYNPGGYSITSRFLCSSLAPDRVVRAKEIYLQQVWNKRYTDYFKSQKLNTYEFYEYELEYTDEKNIKVRETIENLNLNKIYIITGSKTASASEATIAALSPYMEVITIGESTAGKYYGGVLLQPSDYNMKAKELENWGAYLMIYRYANKNGYPDHANGLSPDHYLKEDILLNAGELGDPNEPLLAKAIELITGVASPAASQVKRNYENPFKRAFDLERGLTPQILIDNKIRPIDQ